LMLMSTPSFNKKIINHKYITLISNLEFRSETATLVRV
jgi:hypothetical protein